MRPILEVDSVVSIQRGLGYWEELEGKGERGVYFYLVRIGGYRWVRRVPCSYLLASPDLHGIFSASFRLVLVELGRDCIYFSCCVCFSPESALKWCLSRLEGKVHLAQA